MKIISWNVNGIRSVFKKGFSEWLEKENPDTLCLQEIKGSEIPTVQDLFTKDSTSKYFTYLNSAVKKGYSGVAVFSKEKPLKVINKIDLVRFDDEGRFLELHFEKFVLINIYIPHGARDKRNLEYKLGVYNILTKYLESIKNKPIVICGDFNVAHEEIDLARPKGNLKNIMFTPEERLAIGNLLGDRFIDTFRSMNPSGGNYSWWPYRKGLREQNVGWRIDYILLSKASEELLEESFILKDVMGSDHCPVGIVLKG